MPAIPDSLLYFDCTPAEKARSKRGYACISAMFALCIGCGAIGIARDWFLLLFGGLNLLWAGGKLWEAKKQERLLDEAIAAEVMEA